MCVFFLSVWLVQGEMKIEMMNFEYTFFCVCLLVFKEIILKYLTAFIAYF